MTKLKSLLHSNNVTSIVKKPNQREMDGHLKYNDNLYNYTLGRLLSPTLTNTPTLIYTEIVSVMVRVASNQFNGLLLMKEFVISMRSVGSKLSL